MNEIGQESHSKPFHKSRHFTHFNGGLSCYLPLIVQKTYVRLILRSDMCETRTTFEQRTGFVATAFRGSFQTVNIR